ncbi:hypothetical protein NECAME_06258 [Necator americanus]|uniref:Secreted protein n=1 Tax=Necator americanus TaxID=51031 RepID=W2TUH4_NECAM|nr:hypothetical protein NECAME_06258 [Necator americanus]ETN85745.1 hypothetical protein NECAME_06258 [Necator americanus]
MRRSSILFVLIAIATFRAEASHYHHNLHGHRLTAPPSSSFPPWWVFRMSKTILLCSIHEHLDEAAHSF